MSRRYSHLTESDRLLVQLHLSQGESQNSIAKRIGCSPSTVSRELARARAHTGHLDRYFAFEGQLVHDRNRKSAGRDLAPAFLDTAYTQFNASCSD
jgi:IS30 family transposase